MYSLKANISNPRILYVYWNYGDYNIGPESRRPVLATSWFDPNSIWNSCLQDGQLSFREEYLQKLEPLGSQQLQLGIFYKYSSEL